MDQNNNRRPNLFDQDANQTPNKQNQPEDSNVASRPDNLFDAFGEQKPKSLFEAPVPTPRQASQQEQAKAQNGQPPQPVVSGSEQQRQASKSPVQRMPQQSSVPVSNGTQEPFRQRIPQQSKGELLQEDAGERQQRVQQLNHAVNTQQAEVQPPRQRMPEGAVASAAANMRIDDQPTRVQPVNGASPGMGVGNGGGNRRPAVAAGESPKKGKNMAKAKKRKRPSALKYAVLNVLKVMFCFFCAAVVVGSGVAVWVAGYMVEATRNDDMLLDLEHISMSQTGYMMAVDPSTGNWIEYQKIVGDTYASWTSLSDISDYVKQAIIATEDKEFYDHPGFSLRRTAIAAVNQVLPLSDKEFGASTIDQQLVKNLTGDKVVLDDDGGMSAGYLRKLREIFRAVGLNNNYSKDIILEAYLNTMPLSGIIVGVGGGAHEYFNKEPTDLTLAESAMIAGITNWPSKYNPYTRPDDCLTRRNNVLLFMYQDGYITKAEYDEAKAQPLGLYTGTRDRDTAGGSVTTWFGDLVYEQVLEDLQKNGFAEDRASAVQFYLNQGLVIYTTVDLTIQEKLEDIYLHAYEEDTVWPTSVYVQEEGNDGEFVTIYPQSAMTVMDYEGNILAVVGGVGEKTGSLVYNRANVPRQVGSTMKGVAVYPLGLEYGLISYSSKLLDDYAWWRNPSNPTYDANGSPVYDWPENFGARSRAKVAVYSAIAQSLNTVAVRVGIWVGIENMYEFATESLGITTLDEVYDANYSSLVIGGQYNGISTKEMAAAYAMYGNGGDYWTPRCYEKVTDSNGNLLMTADHFALKAISEETAYIMNKMLQGVMSISGGTANGQALGYMPSAGKTGTTSDDKDRWFVGLTPYYVSCIWWGYDDNYSFGTYSPAASTNPTVQVWKQLMTEIQEEHEYKDFPEQPERVVQMSFCADTGDIATAGCPVGGTGWYNANHVDRQTCTGVHAPAEDEVPVE